MNQVRQKNSDKISAALKLHDNALWAADLERIQQDKEDKREIGVAKRKDKKEKKDLVQSAEKNLKVFICEKYEDLNASLDKLRISLDALNDSASQSPDKKLKSKLLGHLRDSDAEFSMADEFRRNLKDHLDELQKFEQASANQIKKYKQMELEKFKQKIEKENNGDGSGASENSGGSTSEEQDDNNGESEEDQPNQDEEKEQKIDQNAHVNRANPSNCRKKLSNVLKEIGAIIDRAAKNDFFISGTMENISQFEAENKIKEAIVPVFNRSNKWNFAGLFVEQNEDDVTFQVSFLLKTE